MLEGIRCSTRLSRGQLRKVFEPTSLSEEADFQKYLQHGFSGDYSVFAWHLMKIQRQRIRKTCSVHLGYFQFLPFLLSSTK